MLTSHHGSLTALWHTDVALISVSWSWVGGKLTPQGQHCPKIMKPPHNLPLQRAECLIWAQPDPIANHVTDRSISDRRALTWLATETGWARSKHSAICSGKLISAYTIPYDVNRRYGIQNIYVQVCGLHPVLWTVDHTSYIICHYFLSSHWVLKYTAWWQKHNSVNNLPKLLQLSPIWHVGCKSEQTSTHSELRRTSRKRDQTLRTTPILADLHWLPVKYRIQYKVAGVVYKILTTQELAIRCHVLSRYLRSCNRNSLQKDRTNLVFTDCSFSQAAPTVWNNLPQHVISDLSNLTSFKGLLKTELWSGKPPLIRDGLRTCDFSLSERLDVCQQLYNNNKVIQQCPSETWTCSPFITSRRHSQAILEFSSVNTDTWADGSIGTRKPQMWQYVHINFFPIRSSVVKSLGFCISVGRAVLF